MILTGEGAFIEGSIHGPSTLELDQGRITAVRAWQNGDPPVQEGLLMPGLVNAHLHLELSWAHGLIPEGLGFDGWAGRLMSSKRPSERHLDVGLAMLLESGTAAVSDICNGPDTLEVLGNAGLHGIVQREILGMHGPRLPGLLERAAEPPREHTGMVSRASPHAVYSTPPALLKATIAAEGLGHPASIHVCESETELAFVKDASGPLGPLMDAAGIDWTWEGAGRSSIGELAANGLLHDLLLVHGVLFDAHDRELVAKSGCPVVLCARSNLYIDGRLPDVPALLKAGIPLALGTDSLASCADLDVLNEVEVLTEAFPHVPLTTWLQAVTAGGADALKVPVGRLQVGSRPKVLRVHPERPWTSREVCVG